MGRSIQALINPDVLRWAREYTGFDLIHAAQKAGVEPADLKEWESGSARPTIRELRDLAKTYKFPIAVFYLSAPPTIKRHHPTDRRFFPGLEFEGIGPELSAEFRRAEERREIALDLLQNVGRHPKPFRAHVSLSNTPERVAGKTRQLLGATYDEQVQWRKPRVAMNAWREKIEALDVLVFQSRDVPLEAMRGYSMFFDVLPVIGANPKDSPNARTFTLLHELAHLMLGTGSICDLESDDGHLSTRARNVEIFCNNVAGWALVPREHFLREGHLQTASGGGLAAERAIADLATTYSVSREVIIGRMLALDIVDEQFYQAKRQQYNREYAATPRRKDGYVHPIVNALSTSGRPFVGLVLENLNRGAITTADFSDFVGIKIKHLDQLRERFLLR